jgi:hypothetical protein
MLWFHTIRNRCASPTLDVYAKPGETLTGFVDRSWGYVEQKKGLRPWSGE